MNVRVDSFHGIQPRVHPSLLADGMAMVAHNCRLKSGKLVPLRQPSLMSGKPIHFEGGLGSIADAKSLYSWKHTDKDGDVLIDFLAFPGIVDFAEGNIANDEYDRLFVAGDTGVPFTDADGKRWENSPAVYLYSRKGGVISRKTICKTPLPAPSVSRNGDLDTDKTVYYVTFFVSWVDVNGYESGLSPVASVAVDQEQSGTLPLNAGSNVIFQFGQTSDIPASATKIYVYVSAAGTSEASDGLQFMAEVLRSVAIRPEGFSLLYLPDSLGEAEPGIESPPGDLCGIQFVAGGFYAGFSKSSPHTVMFSDIGIVTSWPVAYRYDVKDNIVALATTSNSVFALTDGWPWVLSGTAPESMSVAKLAGPAACVSPRGVCVYRNSVYYTSHEGLMAIVNDANAGTVCANLTQKAFTKEQWLALNPKSCLLAQYDGALFAFFWNEAGNPLRSLVIDLAEGADAISTHGVAARCLCSDNRDDRLYIVGDTFGGRRVGA